MILPFSTPDKMLDWRMCDWAQSSTRRSWGRRRTPKRKIEIDWLIEVLGVDYMEEERVSSVKDMKIRQQNVKQSYSTCAVQTGEMFRRCYEIHKCFLYNHEWGKECYHIIQSITISYTTFIPVPCWLELEWSWTW